MTVSTRSIKLKKIFNSLRKHFLAITLIFFISVWSVWPIIKDIKYSLPGNGDAVFLVWVLNQTINKIPHDILNIFNGNIFYPHRNTMFYSVLMIPSALISYIPVKILGEPAVAFGTSLLVGQILTSLVLYFWFYDISKNKYLSLLCSIALILSQIRFSFTVHLQMWNMQWFLLSTWMIRRFAKTKKTGYLVLATLFAIIQTWESLLPLVFIATTALIIFCFEKPPIIKIWKKMIMLIGIFLILTAPVTLGYLTVSREFHYARPIREVAHFSGSLNDLWGIYLSIGLYLITLTSVIKYKGKYPKWIITLIFTGIVMFLGPVLKWSGQTFKIFNLWVPLPYGVLYYVFPFMRTFRSPARWIWIVALGLSMLSLTLLKKEKSRIVLIFLLLIAIFGGTGIKRVYKLPSKNDIPQVYLKLKDLEKDVVLEYPVYSWADGEVSYNENMRMVYSLWYKKSLVNGASGFTPPDWERVGGVIRRDFPDNSSIDELEKLQVDYVIVHKNEVDPRKLIDIENWGKERLIWEDNQSSIYGL